MIPVLLIENTDELMHFKVTSKSRPDMVHDVYFDIDNGFYCSCEQYHYRKKYCKHMKQVKEYMNSLNERIQNGKTFNEIKYGG